MARPIGNCGILLRFLEITRTGPTVRVDGFHSKEALAEASSVKKYSDQTPVRLINTDL